MSWDAVAKEVAALDDLAFASAASYTSASLAAFGRALVELAPGDATLYRFSIIDSAFGALHEDGRVTDANMGGNRYLVASTFGLLYAWSGRPMEPDYAFEHYVIDPKGVWTAHVIARFLTEVAGFLNPQEQTQ